MRTSNNQPFHASVRRRLHNALRALALVSALLALTASTAAAQLAQAAPSYGDPSPTQTIVRVITPSTGFDWGDAGIGAAAGLAISLVALGAALAVSHRREHHVRASINPIA